MRVCGAQVADALYGQRSQTPSRCAANQVGVCTRCVTHFCTWRRTELEAGAHAQQVRRLEVLHYVPCLLRAGLRHCPRNQVRHHPAGRHHRKDDLRPASEA